MKQYDPREDDRAAHEPQRGQALAQDEVSDGRRQRRLECEHQVRLAALLLEQKRLHDVATSNVLQRAVEAYVTVGRYQAHLRRTVRVYRRRRDALMQALRHHLPGLTFVPPRGGLFVWARLPEGVTARRLLPLAREAGVDFAPGTRFFPDADDGDPFVRLTFAAHEPHVLDEAVRRLARAVRRVGR